MRSKSERTKQFIIEKTAPVFNTKGYAGTSLNDMITVTGLTKGSIYGNFENKDEVAIAAFDYNFGVVAAYLKLKVEEQSTVIDKLLVYPETYRNFLKLPFLKSGCPLLNTSTEADDTHPLLRQKVADALKLWKTSIEKHIQQGIKTKEIKASSNASEFAAVLMALIEGSVMQAKVTGKATELNCTMNFLEKMIRDLKK
jgi:TetR/AcrR family transcriptional repressor of nem operon